MSNDKFAPGPWHLEPSHLEGHARVVGPIGADVADVIAGPNTARLIAAAPELLALLREKSIYNAGYTNGNCQCPMLAWDESGGSRFIDPDGSCWDCRTRELLARIDGAEAKR